VGGRVEALFVAPAAEAVPAAHDAVEVEAGRGVVGDRYHAGTGTFSDNPGDGRHLTLVAAEALEALEREHGIALPAAESRRNVLTRGIDLNTLVGRRFSVGAIECVGRRLCEPCDHLERLTEPGVLRGLVHRGGLRADVERGGVLEVGADVVDLGPAASLQ